MKFPLKTVAACAVTALAVGATSATAGTLINSAKIKDGAVHLRDLSPGVKAQLAQAGAPGVAGTNGVNGANGVDGVNGKDGKDGKAGLNGQNGSDGRDGVRFDRVVGSCDTVDRIDGEISIARGMARLGVPKQNSWAQIRSYPSNLTVADLDELSFRASSTDEGQTYLKVRTTGNGTITFSPNTQPGGERIGEMVDYDVLKGTSRWNDDAGIEPDFTWEQILEKSGPESIKSISIIAGCAMGDGGETLVDDITVNDEVIDFA